MKTIEIKSTVNVGKAYDVIVAGAGVAGVAAAIQAKRHGKSVLLLEKMLTLGGLATAGLINFFVPICNGRGTQIIKGMNDEFLKLSISMGYDSVPEAWKNGDHPVDYHTARYVTRYSPNICAMLLAQLVHSEGVDLLLDCVASEPVMKGNHCEGLVVQTKGGRVFYPGKVIIDCTGDADILARAGVPTILGTNFFTYGGRQITMETCKKALQTGDIQDAMEGISGGGINLYGHGQPDDVPLYTGVTSEEITDYILRNQKIMLDKLKETDRKSREVAMLPTMPQFRTTRRIEGDYTLTEQDAYRHFDDSIAAICDFDRYDYLYEVPYRTLLCKKFDNLLTAGRSAAGVGYAWDILRVIPPAIVTGQAAGAAAVLAIEQNVSVADVHMPTLQARLAAANVMIHFDDGLIPSEAVAKGYTPVPDYVHN